MNMMPSPPAGQDRALPKRVESNLVRDADAVSQAVALATAIAKHLEDAVEKRGRARIAFSGGSTPRLMLNQLAKQPLAWSRVDITLVDERCVAEDDARSNAGMLRRHLLDLLPARPRFYPLYLPDEDAAGRDNRFEGFGLPFDLVHLGMGDDAHTASFFPDSQNIEAMLDLEQPSLLMQTQSLSSRERRITWSLAALLRARHLVLQLVGSGKQAVLTEVLQVMGSGTWAESQFYQMPVLAVLARTRLADAGGVPAQIYYASE